MAFWHRKKKKQNSLRAEENAQEQNLSQEVAEEMTGEEKRLSEKELAADSKGESGAEALRTGLSRVDPGM